MREKKGYNRRDFLKIIGASSGVAASGCARELPEKLIPYVVQPDEIIPGVASWYAGACTECGAGCGTMVRTREGRVVKVEGNPLHPLNKGGLCAIGQSTVQGLYDPDRVREPLARDVNGAFRPVSWEEAVKRIGEALAAGTKTGRRTLLVTRPLQGSEKPLVEAFAGNVSGTAHIPYELLSRDVIDQAVAASFGSGLHQHFDFSKADVIASFGADYLETWLSPVAFTKGFAAGRRPDGEGRISKVFHVEPRLSLTAANADHWYANRAGSEHRILQALLKELVDGESGRGLPSSAKGAVRRIAGGASVESLLEDTGISAEQLATLAGELARAEHSLVVAGGLSGGGAQGKRAAMLANAINVMLGNIGTTVLLYSGGEPVPEKTSYERLVELESELQGEESPYAVGIISGVNPVYSFPGSGRLAKALSKIPLLVSHSTHLDETAKLAHIVLPKSTQFEAWSDAEPLPGVYSLNQPAMQPLYESLSLGDLLLSLSAGKALNAPIGSAGSYHEYIQEQWKSRTGDSGFEDRWLGYVETGGDWSSPQRPLSSASLAGSAFDLPAEPEKLRAGLRLLAFPTVHYGDGSPANRPWMQEVPDPMTTAVWGSWIELHPDTAAKAGVEKGQVVQLKTPHGSLEAPVYVTKHIHPDVAAMPIGLGHEGYGRYAAGVGVNTLKLLPAESASGAQQFLTESAQIAQAIARDQLVTTQGHDSQEGRGIIRTIAAERLAKKKRQPDRGGHAVDGPHSDHAAGSGGEDHGGGHHDPHALGPRPEPKQMYKQMDHVQYRWGMSVDLASCTGCTACVAACYAENNVPVVGKDLVAQRREMSWIRIERYIDGPEDSPVTGFLPMMCQHCGNAPCEPVCPVYATYHSDEGLNTMVYNRCVGTRYCSNNCSYKVRRFNWFKYEWPEPLNWQLNPDVTVRSVGVMEKCSFCIQRIREGENKAKDLGRPVKDGEIQPACASSCPADAIKFGNLEDHESEVYKDSQSERSYRVLDFELNTQPAVNYLAKVTHRDEDAEHGHS